MESREARRQRRIALAAFGRSAVASSGFPGRKINSGGSKLRGLVRTIARDRGLAVGSDAVAAYEISGRGNYLHEMQKHKVRQRVMVAVHRDAIEGKKHTPLKRVLVVHTQNSRVTGIFEYIQR
jgi:hypothetical protein